MSFPLPARARLHRDAGRRLEDATVYKQSYAYGDGEMNFTIDDLDRFTMALFAGRLLSARLLQHMFAFPSMLRRPRT
ncbi:hypothetical protein [Streptomyces sp. NPDC018000]|uniref:hypothetical protein n=1 Tax=Streptomyces sp. NPDC018000 TaxID=3365028 RepID=UPI0037B02EC7